MAIQQMPLKMRQDIQGKIADLKIECGDWGRERRLKYLLEKALTADMEIDLLEEMYLDNFKQDGEYMERVVIAGVIKMWEKIKERWIREMKITLAANGQRNGEITDEMIATAKEYPIENLLEIKNGRARCISETHADKNPSMNCKNNFVYCYSCGYTGDVIAAAMKLKGLGFVSAVKFLNGR